MLGKVLIAEDDKFLANAYRVKLTKEGSEIDIVGDGEEAISKVKTESYALVLLDLIMPKKDGFSVLEEMKADEKCKNIPVIVASNLGQQEDIDKAKKLGASEYFIKSNSSLADLITKVKQVLGL